MQHITLLCIGKATGYVADGVREYGERLRTLCKWQVVELDETPIREKSASPAVIKAALEREGERILALVPRDAVLCAMCVEGKQLSSEAFAARLADWALTGRSRVCFAIGSSHGLAPAVKQRADLLLSLSEMTLPHQLARLMLAEQLYRAFSIQNGGRYHK